jgi:hypothetical protein
VVSNRIVMVTRMPPMTHAPKRFIHTRTTPIGPHRARRVQITAAIPSHTPRAEKPKTRCDTRSATSDMAQNSTAVHPTSCIAFSALGSHEPLNPRIGRNRTMVGTP